MKRKEPYMRHIVLTFSLMRMCFLLVLQYMQLLPILTYQIQLGSCTFISESSFFLVTPIISLNVKYTTYCSSIGVSSSWMVGVLQRLAGYVYIYDLNSYHKFSLFHKSSSLIRSSQLVLLTKSLISSPDGK